MKQQLVSIVIPVYNAENTLERLVNHVLSQSFQELEIILIDDGSTDNSGKICEKIAKRDARVKILSQKNSGASSARNLGISKACGRYLMFFDADDDIEPTMIPKMTNVISKQQVDLVTCGFANIAIQNSNIASTTLIGVSRLPQKTKSEQQTTYVIKLLGIDSRLYNPWNKIFRTDIIRKYNIHFEQGLDFGEDLTFNLHYLSHVHQIKFINEALYDYYFDAASGTFGKSSLVYENRRKNYRELLKFAGGHTDAATQDYLGWIKYYWFYSFALAVCGSNKTLKQKLRLLKNAAKTETFRPAATAQYIGRKKLLLERSIGALSHSAFVLWLFTSIFSSVKRSRLFANLWRRMTISLTANK